MTRANVAVFAVCSALLVSGCGAGERRQAAAALPVLGEVPQARWDALASKAIYFGHQSVGYNIVQGLEDVLAAHRNIRLRVVESADARDPAPGVFLHSAVGKNMNPGSKMEAFSSNMRGGIGSKTDLAILKLCFVDVTPETDAPRLLQGYRAMVQSLRDASPDVTFVHVTVPLTSDFRGGKAAFKAVKDLAKKVLKRTNYYDNRRRNEFNELLRKEYGGKEPLLDLAMLEAVDSRGMVSWRERGGVRDYTLLEENSYDGGHLNERGRRLVAEQLLILLAGVQ